MTDKPRTMQLAPHEWRALVGTTANNIYSFVSSLGAEKAPDPNAIAWLHDTIDRLQMQVAAWQASGLPAIAPTSASEMRLAGADIEAGDLVMTNGAGSVVPAIPKKKRGWQKGRKRGPRKPKSDEAVQ